MSVLMSSAARMRDAPCFAGILTGRAAIAVARRPRVPVGGRGVRASGGAQRSVRERVDAGQCPAQSELVDLVGALVGEDGLEVDGVAQRRVLARDAGAAEQRAQVAGDV